MKKHERILFKIKEVNCSLKWIEIRHLLDKLEFEYKQGKKHNVKVYIGRSVWTLHVKKHSLDPGSISILKNILITEGYLIN